jgi:hypothetical protein
LESRLCVAVSGSRQPTLELTAEFLEVALACETTRYSAAVVDEDGGRMLPTSGLSLGGLRNARAGQDAADDRALDPRSTPSDPYGAGRSPPRRRKRAGRAAAAQSGACGPPSVGRLLLLDSRLDEKKALDTLVDERLPHLVANEYRERHSNIRNPEDTTRDQLLSSFSNMREFHSAP